MLQYSLAGILIRTRSFYSRITNFPLRGHEICFYSAITNILFLGHEIFQDFLMQFLLLQGHEFCSSLLKNTFHVGRQNGISS